MLYIVADDLVVAEKFMTSNVEARYVVPPDVVVDGRSCVALAVVMML